MAKRYYLVMSCLASATETRSLVNRFIKATADGPLTMEDVKRDFELKFAGNGNRAPGFAWRCINIVEVSYAFHQELGLTLADAKIVQGPTMGSTSALRPEQDVPKD